MVLKNAVLFVHLIAMAIAVARILEFDLRFLLNAHAPMTAERRSALRITKSVVSAALAVLWASGALLIGLGLNQTPDYLANEKLWAKVLIVSCLTLNGWVLHRWAFPVLQVDIAFLDLPAPKMLGLAGLATLSSVSWLYASFLGIARSWNHSVAFSYTAAIYAALVAGAAATAMLVLLVARHRRHGDKGRRPCLQS